MKYLRLTNEDLANLIILAAQSDPDYWESNSAKATIYRCREAVKVEKKGDTYVNTIVARVTIEEV